MENVTFESELPWDKSVSLVPGLKLPQLDHLERDGVTIQCINSSEFVVGKQTNFNGPVTIISCTEVLKQTHNNPWKTNEGVIIEDTVLSPSAAMKVQKLAEEKVKPDQQEHPAGQEKATRLKNLKKYSSVFVVLGLIITVTIPVLVPFTPEGPSLKCTSLPGGACIYSGFSWGGRPTSNQTKSLKTPASYVVLSETHQDFCYDVTQCLEMVKIFQLNATKPACNFLLGGDGNAYEDRGWSLENSLEGPAAGKSLRFCFLGHFSEEIPTYPQFVVAKTLIQFAVDNNYVLRDYVLMATNATCPDDILGTYLYEIVKKWALFSENPFS